MFDILKAVAKETALVLDVMSSSVVRGPTYRRFSETLEPIYQVAWCRLGGKLRPV